MLLDLLHVFGARRNCRYVQTRMLGILQIMTMSLAGRDQLGNWFCGTHSLSESTLFSGSAMPPTPFAINLNPIGSLLDPYWIAIGFLFHFGSVPRGTLHVSTYSRIPD